MVFQVILSESTRGRRRENHYFLKYSLRICNISPSLFDLTLISAIYDSSEYS